ncbi:hypothetical protein [Phycicoccus flavus]|uniref:hypothetical protein n=1 Tax=Phycicoccus flavus TaxID=2502783 RepID=UPI000FEB716A|nr:hypothetical protein [Phycicoccus flavus]NHA68448.1 hypothetical protein [Phycicoccus flavus]
MPRNISRRSVATGAAWAVPVVAVGAAAPALAASGCTAVTSLSGTHTNGSRTVSITAVVAGGGAQVCITSLNAIGGGNGGVTLSYGGTACTTTSSVTFSATTSDNGNNNKGTFRGTITYLVGGTSCSQQVTFTVR